MAAAPPPIPVVAPAHSGVAGAAEAGGLQTGDAGDSARLDVAREGEEEEAPATPTTKMAGATVGGEYGGGGSGDDDASAAGSVEQLGAEELLGMGELQDPTAEAGHSWEVFENHAHWRIARKRENASLTRKQRLVRSAMFIESAMQVGTYTYYIRHC